VSRALRALAAIHEPQRALEALEEAERQVASLAADGLSNREIAEQLVVTVKTVEWHLKHSYRKLGVRSRQALRPFFEEDSGA
jgi:DNA-binding NarL/FixJ family response regulator